jgi:plasmid maintenance system antidote protein VapI
MSSKSNVKGRVNAPFAICTDWHRLAVSRPANLNALLQEPLTMPSPISPAGLRKIIEELGFSDTELAGQLDLEGPGTIAELKNAVTQVPEVLAQRLENLLDDCRLARLILEKRIKLQYADLLAQGPKPARIQLTTELDNEEMASMSSTTYEARLSLQRQIDREAQAYFGSEGVKVVSKVIFVKLGPQEKARGDLNVKIKIA